MFSDTKMNKKSHKVRSFFFSFYFFIQDSSVAERVVKLIDVGLKSTHLPSKVSTLHGMLYLLEANIADLTKSILPLVTDFLLKHLSAVSK